MRLQVFIFSSYVGDAWTVLRGVQIVMTDDQCTRIAAFCSGVRVSAEYPELDPLRTLSRRTFLPLEVERIFRNLGVPTIRA